MEVSESSYILLPLIACAAFFIKALSGFGPAIVVVAFGSLLLPPHLVIPLSAMLDTTAGSILFLMDPVTGPKAFWIPLTIAIVLGSVLGSILLAYVPPETFRPLLGICILILAIWFMVGRTGLNGGALSNRLPDRCSSADIAVSGVGGFMGGFIGISGPPILWHFGRRFAKQALRRTLIPIFLAAAIARVLTYTGTELISEKVLLCYAVSLPGLLLGIFLGNRMFVALSEKTFSRIIGLVLLVTAVRILM